MPTWGEILREFTKRKTPQGTPDYDGVRRQYLSQLARHTGRDTILYAAKWTQAGDIDPNLISITEEDVQGLMEVVRGLRSRRLDLIVHSPGGSAEATEAIVSYLRWRFDHIRFIVPQIAMSAATLLACAADEIVMGAHSSLGPIDPQFILSGQFGVQAVPAFAILDQFERAKEECKDPELLGAWVPMLNQYGPALLKQCENALALAENLATDWLESRMLRGKPDAGAKAREIARTLNNHDRFKSHARHISQQQAKDIGLSVVELEKDRKLQDLVLSVFHSTTLTFDNTSAVKLIENHLGRAFVKAQQTIAFQVPMQAAIPQPPSGKGPATPPKSIRR